MNVRRILGWLLVGFAALLAYSQTLFLLFFMEHQAKSLGDFPRRYAIESSIEYYGLSLVVLTLGILVLRRSSRVVAWVALAVALLSLWIMVEQELWLHFVELPRRFAHFQNVHQPYFRGTYWMFTPRFLWHLILPVTVAFSVLYVFEKTPKQDS